MEAFSLLGVASYLPERVVGNDFFAPGAASRRGMFTAPTSRRHVVDESAVDMIERAARRLVDEQGLVPARDIDVIFTNVAIPDQAFTGCGAEVAHRIGAKPTYVIDLHNSGCVAFIVMMDLARRLLGRRGGALLCNVQNAGGRVFARPGVREKSQSPVPGDGCGVGWVAASAASPIVSLVQRCHPENAADMIAIGDDGRRYWEPGTSPIGIGFTEQRVASIIERGNRLVPEIVREACAAAEIDPHAIDLLVTNQPNPIFLRNWREALELPAAKHHDTFDVYGNLFGAALPIDIDDALARGKLHAGDLLALGGFAHAGDYTAAALIRWQGGA
jgi:3-oxoacyl-[acyl-carrier-protein] synthase-3